MSPRILTIVGFRGQACWLHKKVCKWVLSDSQMTGTNVSLIWSWSCDSYRKAHLFIMRNVGWVCECARCTCLRLKCGWNGRCAKIDGLHFNLWLQYNSPKICESCPIKTSLPSLQLTSEISFCGYLLIEVIWLWSCPVHTWDVDLSKFWLACWMGKSVDCCVLTEIDIMDSILLSTCDACGRIHMHCHLVSLLHVPLKWSPYESSFLLDPGYISDQASWCL